MKILVTGATGFLGSRLIEKLNSLNYINEIIATGRKLRKTHFVESQKIKYVLGDLSDKLFVNQITSEVDILINCASLSSPWGTYSDFEKANIDTQINLIEASKNNKVKKIIYISSPGVYYEFKDIINISEKEPLPKTFVNHYSKTKFLAEELLKSSKVPYIIFRPKAIIGRGDHVIVPRLIKAYDEQKLKIVGNGNNLIDLTPVSNVVDAIILAVNNDNAINETFNLSNGNPVKLWDVINYVLKKLDRTIVTKKVPYWIAYLVSYTYELHSKVFNTGEPTTTRYSIGVLAKSCTLNIEKAFNLLKYVPNQTTEEAIEEFLKWYKSKE
tara:strand:- start:4184 stop:5164 length:981 start_codon:yes stop_codon:yes gene_type:complete